ncbi:hypothetical protein [uncultured Salinicola sp.]|uniref:hypothetical protein n=1 Tax=uncultured Salinicola sp. TaxID=1193542 RepID=UPI00261094F4|nr:hypothetical protein [uncultured Salinicola sp.]|tara:strand:- start:2254 stop:2745 length:492 start_codon:yes stop_codon:yes gene_type:complete
MQASPSARKRVYTIDAGTHSVLASLDHDGEARLHQILADFDRHLKGMLGGSRSGVIDGPITAGSGTAERITLEIDDKTITSGRIVATVAFSGGILWRRGSLRIPGVTLPKALMLSIKGRRIGDVVEGAPFPDFLIRNAIHDQSANGNKLRIRCTGDEQREIGR